MSMFWDKKRGDENNKGFVATLRLPKYIPKEELLGKVVFDYELERIGQAIDWTYTPDGHIALIVTGRTLRERLKGQDRISVPFEYIDRVGSFILLTKPLDVLLPKEIPPMKKERGEEKEEVKERPRVEKRREEKAKEEEKKEKRKEGKRRKRRKKELKSFDELEEELFANLIEAPVAPQVRA